MTNPLNSADIFNFVILGNTNKNCILTHFSKESLKVESLNNASRIRYSRPPQNKGIFWNKGSDVIIYTHDATNEILSSSSNYIADIVMWPNFGYSSIFMTEVIISQIIYGFVQKTDFEGWSWFKFNCLGLALSRALKFYSSVAKGLKLKSKRCWGELVGGLFGIPPSRPVKTISCSCV